jgi:hypothetical protein
MAINYPSSLDTSSTLPQPGSGDLVSSVDHAQLHDNSSLAIIAAETKVGTGSSTPTGGTVLRGNGTGTSQWAQANLTTDVTGTLPVANGGTGATAATGTGNVVLANTPSLTNPAFSSITNTGTLTLPSSTDTLVGRVTTDTLTNKSINGASNTLTNIPIGSIATTSGALQSWTPTFTGFSANPSGGLYYYTQIGKLVTLFIAQPNAGTSNSTGFTISLPVTARTLTNMIWSGYGQILDNGASPVSPGILYIITGGTTLTVYKDWAGSVFTASGSKKLVFGNVTYEAA